jgi:hypothetical protein
MSIDRYSVGVKRSEHVEWHHPTTPGRSAALAGSAPIHPTTGAAR